MAKLGGTKNSEASKDHWDVLDCRPKGSTELLSSPSSHICLGRDTYVSETGSHILISSNYDKGVPSLLTPHSKTARI